jgi:outer membrane protein TolC
MHAKHRTAVLAAAGLLMAATPPARAADEIPILRWEDVENALDRHPALRLAVREADEAAAEVTEARQIPNPSLELGVGRAEGLEEPVEANVWEIAISQALPWPGGRGGAIAAVEADRDAAIAEAGALRLAVEREMAETFWHIVHDQARLEVLEESLRQIEELVGVATVRVDLGETRRMELDRLDIERARMDAELAGARSEAAVHRQRLRLWLAPGLPEEFRAEGELGALPRLPRLDQAVERARSRHPEVVAASDRVRAAAARLRSARAARFPELAVRLFREEELDSRTWGGALEATLPFWSRNGGGITKALAAVHAAELRRELRATDLEAAVRATHAEAASAYERARTFRDVIRPKARATTAAVERMYQVGEIDIMNVLDTRRSRIEIESELLRTLLDSRLAALRLFALTGEIEID